MRARTRLAAIRTAKLFVAGAALTLATAPAAFASSGTLNCGPGGNPMTTSTAYRHHWVQGFSEIWATGQALWPWTVGTKSWYVSPSPGTGQCLV